MGGSVGVFDLIQNMIALVTNTEPMSAVLSLMISHDWSIKSPVTDTLKCERDCVGE